jgi:hypothetical protein
MSASSLNICDSAKKILYHKIFTDHLKVYLLQIQYVQDINRPQHYLEQGKNFENAFSFFLLSDDADSAKQSWNTNNFANFDISAKSLYDVSLGTQRKGLMEKNETKNYHATVPLNETLIHAYDYLLVCTEFLSTILQNEKRNSATSI